MDATTNQTESSKTTSTSSVSTTIVVKKLAKCEKENEFCFRHFISFSLDTSEDKNNGAIQYMTDSGSRCTGKRSAVIVLRRPVNHDDGFDI